MNKNRILVLVFCIFAIIVCGILFYLNSIDKNNIGDVTISYSGNDNIVSIDNSLPLSDKVGRTLKFDDYMNNYFSFTIDCNLINKRSYNYEIYATKSNNSDDISSSYVKVYLTDGDTDKPLSLYDNMSVPTYYELKNSNIKSNSKILYTGECNSNISKKFILRMWLSDTYTVNFNKKQFSVKVNVSSMN